MQIIHDKNKTKQTIVCMERGKNSNFTVEKADKQDLNQMIKGNINSKKSC